MNQLNVCQNKISQLESQKQSYKNQAELFENQLHQSNQAKLALEESYENLLVQYNKLLKG